MSLLRLGSLSSLLSEPLINGFTTGAAVHVTVSQLTDLFGIKIPRYKGAFKIIYVSIKAPNRVAPEWPAIKASDFYFQTVIDCIPRIPDSNVATVVISAIVILLMVFMNEIMKVRHGAAFVVLGELSNRCLILPNFLAFVAATLQQIMQISGAGRIDCGGRRNGRLAPTERGQRVRRTFSG